MDIPLLVVDNKDQVAATQHLLSKCREYVLGLKMEISRKEMPKVRDKECKPVKSKFVVTLMCCQLCCLK